MYPKPPKTSTYTASPVPSLTSQNQIKKDSQVTLPLWLCPLLCGQAFGNSPALTIELPSSLSPRVLNALKADSRTVDLRGLAPHFYQLAAMVLELYDLEEVVDVLSEVCGGLVSFLA